MTQINTKGVAMPTTAAPDNAGEGIKEIAGHITETFIAPVTIAIWFAAILGVDAALSFVHHCTQEHCTWMHASCFFSRAICSSSTALSLSWPLGSICGASPRALKYPGKRVRSGC